MAPDGTLYVYGLATDPTPALAAEIATLAPVEGAATPALIPAGPYTAIASPHDGQEVRRRRRNLLAHTKILEAAMAHATVLPMRFGVVAEDAASLASALSARAEEIARHAARVAGCVELGLRISFPRDAALAALVAADPALTQRHATLAVRGADAHYDRIAFGRHIAEHLDRRRKAAERSILAAVLPSCRSHVLAAPEEDVQVLRAEFLVPANDQGAIVDAAVTAAAATDFAPGAEADVRCVGPAPPYNFVSLSIDAPPVAVAGLRH